MLPMMGSSGGQQSNQQFLSLPSGTGRKQTPWKTTPDRVCEKQIRSDSELAPTPAAARPGRGTAVKKLDKLVEQPIESVELGDQQTSDMCAALQNNRFGLLYPTVEDDKSDASDTAATATQPPPVRGRDAGKKTKAAGRVGGSVMVGPRPIISSRSPPHGPYWHAHPRKHCAQTSPQPSACIHFITAVESSRFDHPALPNPNLLPPAQGMMASLLAFMLIYMVMPCWCVTGSHATPLAPSIWAGLQYFCRV